MLRITFRTTLLGFILLLACAASFAQSQADVADTTALFGYDPASQSKWKDT